MAFGILLAANATADGHVYFNADYQSHSVTSSSASITVENYFMDNGGPDQFSPGTVVNLLVCDNGCNTYEVQSCGEYDDGAG